MFYALSHVTPDFKSVHENYLTHINKTSNAPFVHTCTYDSDQLGHPPFNMIKTIGFDSVDTQGLSTFSCGQQRLWSHLVET